MIQIVGLRGKGTANIGKNGQKIGVKSLAWMFKNLDQVLGEVPENERWNVYYTLAEHDGSDASNEIIRKSKTFMRQEVLAFDIDYLDITKQQSYIDIVTDILCIPYEGMTVVSSGGGLHFIIFLSHMIDDASFFTINKPHYNAICAKINTRMRELGLKNEVGIASSADTVVFEPARILRLPGTKNRKAGRTERDCIILNLNTTPRMVKLHELSGLGELEKDNIPLREVKRNYPNPDLAHMLGEEGCPFMSWAINTPQEIHEPQAFDLFSILAQISDSTLYSKDGVQYTPKALAESVYNGAVASASLQGTPFEIKWEQSCRYGVRKCETISTRHDPCHNCKHFGKIVTPLELRGPNHIATKDIGFWIMNAKGQHSRPHYGDLQRHFENEHTAYVVVNEEMYVFDGKRYAKYENMNLLKGWVEKTMRPSDPVMEVHRKEALKKITTSNILTQDAQKNLFVDSISWKVNFQNGVLDIRTGEFSTHSPRYGFKYVLPYEYDPEANSEYFMEWLEMITCKRPEIIETLFDLMGFCFMPSYDDHAMFFFLGEGANGKSTLMNIIRAMVGERNTSAVSMKQLCQDRFYTWMLDGKLVNLSSEASGREVSSDHLNTLKALSSGEFVSAERKGIDPYDFQNNAKLIFAMNKLPSFEEYNESVKRRLCAIPFDHQLDIRNLDHRIGNRLCTTELQGIATMVIRHARRRYQECEGKYFVRRPGAVEAASRKLMLGDSPIASWLTDALLVVEGEEHYIPSSEVYANYCQWAQRNNIKQVLSGPNFYRKLREIVPKSIKDDKIWDKNLNKQVRITRNVKWKEEVV